MIQVPEILSKARERVTEVRTRMMGRFQKGRLLSKVSEIKPLEKIRARGVVLSNIKKAKAKLEEARTKVSLKTAEVLQKPVQRIRAVSPLTTKPEILVRRAEEVKKEVTSTPISITEVTPQEVITRTPIEEQKKKIESEKYELLI